jgi:hypothetical protein
MSVHCQIEHVYSDSDVGSPCSNRAVAECADCGVAHRRRSSQSLESETSHAALVGEAGQVKDYKLSGTKPHVWRFLHGDLDIAVLGHPGGLR